MVVRACVLCAASIPPSHHHHHSPAPQEVPPGKLPYFVLPILNWHAVGGGGGGGALAGGSTISRAPLPG